MAKPIRGIQRRTTRREVLTGLMTSAAALPLGWAERAWAQDASATTEDVAVTAAPETEVSAPTTPFSFDWLTERMATAASGNPEPREQIDGFLTELDYDDYQRVRFNRARNRWSDDENAPFHLNAFHLGWLFNEPVHLYLIENGEAVPMPFSTADFDYSDVKATVPENFEMAGVAGFRLMTPINRADHFDELAAFLGASYFRVLGRDTLYGLSARGLAVNTGMSDGEEFPRFTEFWIEKPTPGAETVTLYAALRSESVTGAYRFVLRPGETTKVDVTARLFMRRDVQQLGVAPLTSMFLFGGADPGAFQDFRPAVHDSDHLILNTRGGETYVRPLVNPSRLGNSYLSAQDPLSFGLVQRERDFDQFLDAQAHYERRPSLIVEPLGDWGAGSVRLLEIPSDLEGNDNIVAYWVPGNQARAGDALEFSYRLHWGLAPEGDRNGERAQILRTRVGKGGVAGVEDASDAIKFVIDFKGGTLGELPSDADIEPKVTVLRGELTQAILSPVSGTDLWRLVIEAVPGAQGSMELQAALSGYGRSLSETWLYQWVSE
ncbi:glucan biosynthesis protein [Maritimibacter sp. DP1N21-5]|uniref:glucan biosynthesis protein n=1 Tax=Maritimibacter sp. DP1N21-5 TaxID=2836867 RepID=UPI001C471FD0|nr:glucan biosynthesis protein G [Maritimibacter sp. DP1N21-5]MBV7407980.1 glucan biosynthesis protein G [Maritimibacter sp. DP1N21-5]